MEPGLERSNMNSRYQREGLTLDVGSSESLPLRWEKGEKCE